MIKLAAANVNINAPIDQVFNFVINMENYIKWFPGVLSINSIDNSFTNKIGKCYLEKIEINNEVVDIEIQVQKIVKNQRFITYGTLDIVLPVMDIQVKEVNGITFFSVEYYARNKALANNEVFRNALQQDLTQRAKQGVCQLKKLLEQT